MQFFPGHYLAADIKTYPLHTVGFNMKYRKCILLSTIIF